MSALGLFTFVFTVECTSTLCQIRDTLPILAGSKKMQSQDTNLSCLEVDIPDAIAGIEAQIQIATPGTCYASRKTTLRGAADALGRPEVPRSHHSHTDVWLGNQRAGWLQALVAVLKARCPSVPFTCAMHSVFTVSKHPDANATEAEIKAHFKKHVIEIYRVCTRWVELNPKADVHRPRGLTATAPSRPPLGPRRRSLTGPSHDLRGPARPGPSRAVRGRAPCPAASAVWIAAIHRA